MTEKRRITPTKAQAAKPPVEKKPIPAGKKVNPEFIALQIKAEGVAGKFIDFLDKKLKDDSLNQQTINSLDALTRAMYTLQSFGLVVSDRPNLPEPEPEPIVLTESTEALRIATEEALSGE
ncbi:MAG: hypothetical protein P4N59_03430 [Negativicutes bacterium]|nr:hypothetical protein [Negativicutes bacterium]